MAGISAKIPVFADVIVDLSHVNNPDDIKKVEKYLDDYYKKHAKDWEGMAIDVSSDKETEMVHVKFDGDLTYTYYPSNSYYEPDDWEIPAEEDSFVLDVKDTLLDMPFDVAIGDELFKADGLVDDAIYNNEIKLPSDDDIEAALDAQNPDPDPDDYDMTGYRGPAGEYESVLNSVLDGKSLTEALNKYFLGESNVNEGLDIVRKIQDMFLVQNENDVTLGVTKDSKTNEIVIKLFGDKTKFRAAKDLLIDIMSKIAPKMSLGMEYQDRIVFS